MNLDSEQLLKGIIETSADTPVLVDFWAPWCQPCRILGPILTKLAEEAAGEWILKKINVDEHPNLAAQFGIQGIPNVKLVFQGRLIGELTGALPEAEVRQWLEKHLPEKPKGDMDVIRELVAEGQLKKARRMLEFYLKREPDSNEAKVLLAHCLLFDKTDKAVQMVAHISETSGEYQRASWIMTLGELLKTDKKTLPTGPCLSYFEKAVTALRSQNFEAAVDHFLDVLYRDRDYADEAARKACIAIFGYLGHQHPVSKSYRRRFEMALFS